MRSWKADAALLVNAFVWGVTFVLVKDALHDVSPVLYLALRFGLAGSVLLLWYGRKLQGKAVRYGVIAGCLLFLGYIFQTTGLQFTTPSKSAFYTSLSIPLVPLLGALVYKRAPGRMEVAGVCVATIGMVLLTTEGSRLTWDRGSLLSLLCALAFAAHIVAVGYFAERSNFETIAVVQVGTAALLAAISFPVLETPRLRWSTSVIAAVVITALLATALAFTVQAWAQQHTTATRTALIYSLEPVWAWLTSWIVIGERLSRLALGGGLMILLGVLLVEMKREKSSDHPTIRAVSPEV